MKKFTPSTVSMILSKLHDRIVTVDNFLTDEECYRAIVWGEATGFVEFQQAASRDFAFRFNGRIQQDDSSLATAIYERVLPLLPPTVDGLKAKGCSSLIRLYRYSVGQRFGPHIDESNQDKRLGGISVFTLLIYLNGKHCNKVATASCEQHGVVGIQRSDKMALHSHKQPYSNLTDGIVLGDGGETVFYHSSMVTPQTVIAEVKPQRGMLLLHGHGSHCLTHESRVVTSGTKYVLRTDIVYG